MTKKETIWRHILHKALSEKQFSFTQKHLAEYLKISTSTVFNALKVPRKLGAVEVTGRFFRLRDAEKLLLLWATQRNLKNDLLYQTYVDLPAQKIEGLMPSNIIFGAFSAYRLSYNDVPADYGVVYVYAGDPAEIKRRFPKIKGEPNLFVLKADDGLAVFGKATPAVQTFVDLWNMPQWYARDFLDALKQKIL